MTQPNDFASRRTFIQASTATVAGAALASKAVAAASDSQGSYEAFGDREIKVGLVGCGGRGTSAVGQLFNTSGGPIRLVAMADAFDYRLSSSHRRLSRLAEQMTDRNMTVDVPEERQFVGLSGFEGVLESDCDVVVLATPPGFRPAQFEAAIEAGKHVFMEKPVATDAPGIRRVMAAGEKATQKGLAVQVGLQRRHEDKYTETVKRLHDGAIGDIILTRVYWNSSGVWVRPRRPEHNELQYQCDNWYYFNWVCGDQIVEQHIHNIDVSNWVKQATPVEAQGQGGREVRTSKATGQIFDHQMIEYTYPDGTKMLSCSRHIPGAWNQVAEYAHGSQGTADVSGGKILDAKGDLIWRFEGRNPQGHQQEQHDLVANLREGRLPNETQEGAEATMTAILGRMAAYSGKVIRWDEAINSNIDLGLKSLSWDAEPPVKPDEDGRYPVPTVGKEQVV